MENKEVRDWRDRQALKRLEMIAPLMDPDMDDAKRCQMREEIAGKNGITVRSLYRYEKYYREGSFEGLRPMDRKSKKSARLPEDFERILAQAAQDGARPGGHQIRPEDKGQGRKAHKDLSFHPDRRPFPVNPPVGVL